MSTRQHRETMDAGPRSDDHVHAGAADPGSLSLDRRVQFMVLGQLFECPMHYQPLKPVGKGAYGVVCSARHIITGEPGGRKLALPCFFLDAVAPASGHHWVSLAQTAGREVAVKRIGRAFENVIDAKRTLREIRLLRHFQAYMTHENIIQVSASPATDSARRPSQCLWRLERHHPLMNPARPVPPATSALPPDLWAIQIAPLRRASTTSTCGHTLPITIA